MLYRKLRQSSGIFGAPYSSFVQVDFLHVTEPDSWENKRGDHDREYLCCFMGHPCGPHQTYGRSVSPIPAARHDVYGRNHNAFRKIAEREANLRSAFKLPFSAWLLGVGGLFGFHALYFVALQNAPAVEAG